MLKPTKQSFLDNYCPGVKGYDLEKKKFVVTRDVQFFEKKFDHFYEKAKSDDAD